MSAAKSVRGRARDRRLRRFTRDARIAKNTQDRIGRPPPGGRTVGGRRDPIVPLPGAEPVWNSHGTSKGYRISTRFVWGSRLWALGFWLKPCWRFELK